MLSKISSAVYYKLMASLLNLKSYRELRNLRNWSQNSYAMPAPYEVKIKTLKRRGGNEVWIETGTYEGLTAIELSKFAKCVITLEASDKYFYLASSNLVGYSNVELIHGTSEKLLDLVLSRLVKKEKIKDISFWLDAHYSSGETFGGENDCPVIEELRIIQSYLKKISRLTLFIDDVRLFKDDESAPEKFPTLFKIIKWIEENKLFWTIEHDILIISNKDI
jgi:hypothetical protein